MRQTRALITTMVLGLTGQVARAQFPVTDSFDRPTERIDTVRVLGMKREPRWVIKVSPLSLIDVESTYRLDVERIIGGRHSIQGGLGYGDDYTRLFNSSGTRADDRETWRAQAEYRVYTKRDQAPNRWRLMRTITRKPLGDYFAIEVFYKQVNAMFDGTLGRGCEDGTCQFFQNYTARAARYVAGTHFKLGEQTTIRLSDSNNRLLIDYYVGFGLRWRAYREYGVPDYEDARPMTFNSNWDRTSSWGAQRGRSVSLAAGVQIGYAF